MSAHRTAQASAVQVFRMAGNMRIHVRMLASLLLLMIIATHLTAVFAQENETVEAGYTITLSRWSEGGFPPGFYGVEIELKSTSNELIRQSFCPFGDGGFKVSVLYNGVPMEELPRVQKLRKEGWFNTCRGPVPDIKPGGSFPIWVQLSDRYDMSKPGSYQVTLTRETVPGYPLISTTVKSNTLTIVVPEPKAANPK